MVKRRTNELNMDELKTVQSVLPTGNLTISEAVELFIEDCEVRNLREHTIKYYRNEFNAFMGLLSRQGVELNIGAITALVITNNVIKAMQGANIKPVSTNTRLTALKALFNWLHKKRYIKRNPMEEVSKLRERKEVIETLTVKQIEELLNACNLRTFTGVRDYTILLLFIETGVRVNELAGIAVNDIDFSNGNIRIRNAKSYRERLVPIQSRMKEQLRKYLQIRGNAVTDSLFITLDGTTLSKRQIQSRVSEYGKKAGIKGVRCSCHTLRHTFAKLCVLNGANTFQLMSILGHTTLEMTKVYVNLFSSEVAEGHKKFSPLNSLTRR
jgi:integrase/recombinase XerD